MADFKRKRAPYKGQVTKIQKQIDSLLLVEPKLREPQHLDRLVEQLERSTESYLLSYRQFLDDADEMDPKKQEEEEANHEDFMHLIESAQISLCHMREQTKALQLMEVLSHDIEDWEDMDVDHLKGTLDASWSKLQEDLEAFKLSTFTSGGKQLPELRQCHKDFRRRLSKLRMLSSEESKSMDVSTNKEGDSDHHSSARRLHKLPLPTYDGDLMTWRSFWRRFQDYMDKLPQVTDDEKVSYLLDSLKDEAGLKIVRSAITNGHKFNQVEERLEAMYDRPRKVFQQCIKKFQELSTTPYTHEGLVQFQTDVGNLRSVILHYGDNTADQILTALAEEKMSSKFYQEWMLHSEEKGSIPTWELLDKFCTRRSAVLNVSESEHKSHSKSSSKPPLVQQKRTIKSHYSLHVGEQSAPVCKLCHKGNHLLQSCQDFRTQDSTSRYQTVQRLNHCFNCLSSEHRIRECPSKRNCRECGRRHHTMLHKTEMQTPTTSEPTATNNGTALTAAIPDHTAVIQTCHVMLETGGRTCAARAMLDSGSTLSFLTNRVATTLKAKKTPFVTAVTGLGQVPSVTSQFQTTLTLKSVAYAKESPIEIHPALVTSITGITPSNDIQVSRDTDFIQGLTLADPSFNLPGRIDLLLGQDIMPKLMRQGTLNSKDFNLYAQNTALGWVIGGYCNTPGQAVTAHICCRASVDTHTQDLLKAFWETEEPPSTRNSLSKEDQMALDHFKDTHSRLEDGRYQVRLPMHPTPPPLGESRQRAIKRYQQNQRSLSRQGKWNEFSEAVREYSEMQHSEEIPKQDLGKSQSKLFYMPMHGVVKASSTSTKLRIVFDCSAKTSSGFSLNDALLPGPTMYPLLTNVLLKFRNHTVGMSSDIGKMFREVALDPLDRDLHRYIVQDDQGAYKDLRMTRVTFGVASSPFLATQVLRQLADDYEQEFPQAVEVVRTAFYVDDCLTGAKTPQEAQRIRESLNLLLLKARMHLRKWRTNSRELRDTIPLELQEKEPVQHISAPHDCHKALGVHWNTQTDTLHVATPDLCNDDLPTKRQVLSDVARTFDVLGWFSPVTIKLKILLQSIWRLHLEWDQTLPEDLVQIWKSWRAQLPKLTSHPIPRVYHTPYKERRSVQLHGFSDASNLAYAGAVYIRTMYEDTTTTTALVTAKTKVAPLSPLTIPKLELCGALLLSKLLANAQKVLQIEKQNVFAWTDSMIVLAWLRTPPHRLKVYEANRVVSIIEKIPSTHWHHVETHQNPADLGSRGVAVEELVQSSLWWNGPEWLKFPPDQWPITKLDHLPKLPSPMPGLKVTVLTIRESFPEDILKKYSKHEKLICVVAWILRFSANSRASSGKKTVSTHLTVPELRCAERLLVRMVQTLHFSKEVTLLKEASPVPRSSPLHMLNPFLDDKDIIRVGGRLSNSNLNFSRKHPVILPKKSPYTKLLITKLHQAHLHSGPTTLLGILSQQYYVIGARQLTRSITRDCVTCRKSQAKTANQLMSDLPAARVSPAPPFTSVGIDFAGPLTLKKGHTRKPIYVKSYLCVFVCFATKAVHLELAADLSSEAFIAVLTRFVARRGCPNAIWTDNGSNFVGAQRELQEIYTLLENQQTKGDIINFLNARRITWHFSPGRAPHHGGIWEAAVKSAKTLIRKILGPLTLTTEEFYTIICDVEATLNSRPLCHLDAHSVEGIEPLTLGHFIIGRPLKSLPLDSFPDIQISSLKRWNLCRRMSHEFWRRWSKEYLITLQQRSKWKFPSRSFQEGDVVLVKDQELFTRTWPVAIISHCHPGRDGKTRVVTVRTNRGVYVRPITKLVLLVPAEQAKEQVKEQAFTPFPCQGENVEAMA